MKFELETTSSEQEHVESSSAGQSGESRSRLSAQAVRSSRATLLFSRILADAFEDSRGYVHRWNARRGGE